MLKKERALSISVFLLLYYIYMNSVRKVMIPMSSIVVPAILGIVLFVTLTGTKGRIKAKGTVDRVQCVSWILIAVYIFINNESVASNLFGAGMIQLYVMVCFMLFAIKSDEWMKVWIRWTKIFVIIHAVATIFFYFNSGIYSSFVRFFYSSNYTELMKIYNKGWMCGLNSHFSSTGMILAIGATVYFEQIRVLLTQRRTSQNKRQIILHFIGMFLVVYGLILTSKRGPMLAAVLAIIITYVFAQGKNVVKRLVIIGVVCVFVYLAYKYLIELIPGLNTIADKFNSLEDSDAGVLNGRQGLWERALELFRSNPLFGGGFGRYATYASATNAITTSAHNYYLQILAELGILGIVLYIIAFLSGILNCVKQIRIASKYKNPYSIMLLSIALEIQLFVVIYSITSTAMIYYHILIPYFLACTVPRAIELNSDIKRENNQ